MSVAQPFKAVIQYVNFSWVDQWLHSAMVSNSPIKYWRLCRDCADSWPPSPLGHGFYYFQPRLELTFGGFNFSMGFISRSLYLNVGEVVVSGVTGSDGC